MTFGWRLVLFAVCLAGSGFFSGMETGVIAINHLRLRHLVRHRVPGAAILESFLRRPDLFLGTTLVGTNLCHVVASVMGASVAERWIGSAGPLAAGVVTTLLILVGCEYLPKAWFAGFPARRTLPFARLLRFFVWLFYPVSRTIMYLVSLAIPVRGGDGRRAQPFLTREELVHLTLESERTGALTPDETRMIHSVFELSGKICREIMQPRAAVTAVEPATPVPALLELARTRAFTRYPVWDPDQRTFVGIINLFDVLSDPEGEKRTVRDFMRHPQFVADHTPVEHVLPRMRITRQPLMLVTDDRFEVVGLITLEDVLEEIVGRL